MHARFFIAINKGVRIITNNNRVNKNDDLVNERIRFPRILVIGANGTQYGVLSRAEALRTAESEGFDLVCVAPNANPPVCRLMDYGKYRFEQQKKQKEAKKNQHQTEIKQLKLSPVIDVGDFNTKCSQARKWLEETKKVQIVMRFRGRMMTRQEVGKKVLNDFIEALSDAGQVEKAASMEGNIMTCMIAPLRNKGGKQNAKDENKQLVSKTGKEDR